MAQFDDASRDEYPHGRGYGHDYMRGGEVLGGYGYAEREEYAKRRGELLGEEHPDMSGGLESGSGLQNSRGQRTS
jgi:hypothetical protein